MRMAVDGLRQRLVRCPECELGIPNGLYVLLEFPSLCDSATFALPCQQLYFMSPMALLGASGVPAKTPHDLK